MKAISAIVTAGIALSALTMSVAAQIGQINAAPPGPRTGMIVGQVIDATTGEPTSEAIVQLAMPKYAENLPTTPRGRVMADAEGRFFFTELPPGDYYLRATRDGYTPGTYGQRRAWGPGQNLTLGEGERRTDVVLRVWKHAVIGGTVVDEAGEPIVGISVRALVKNVVAGRTVFGNRESIGDLAPIATTDDRGMFRFSRLSRGAYVVVVPSTHTTVPAARLENPDSALRTDLFWGGVQEMTPLGHPRAVQVGEFALMTLNRVVIPPPPTPAGRMQVYRTTYYPAAVTARAATAITVSAGEERTDLTITLHPVPAARVSGRLATPDGSVPPPMMIRLTGQTMADLVTSGLINSPDDVGLETATALSDARGRFSMLGVPPGEYVLSHANRFLQRPINEGKPSYWVFQTIAVGNEDIDDLVVELRPALRVEGRVELRPAGGAPATPPPQIRLMRLETPTGDPGGVAVEMSRDESTFASVAAGGRYIVRPYEMEGWVVQSVTLDGKDITDRTFDLQADATSFVVTYTDRPSKVAGTVTDARGAPSATAVVLVFPVDRQQWSGYGTSSRRLKSALTTHGGVYTFAHLPAGDYYVVAVEDSDADAWQDPARLETLAAQATRLSIATGDSLKTVDLRLRAVQ